MKTLSTVQAVVDALGGDAAAAKIGCVKPKTVQQWKFRKRLPQAKYLVLSAALKRRGVEAAPALWGFHVATRGAAR